MPSCCWCWPAGIPVRVAQAARRRAQAADGDRRGEEDSRDGRPEPEGHRSDGARPHARSRSGRRSSEPCGARASLVTASAARSCRSPTGARADQRRATSARGCWPAPPSQVSCRRRRSRRTAAAVFAPSPATRGAAALSTRGSARRRLSARPPLREVRARDPADPEHPGADVGPQHGADLRARESARCRRSPAARSTSFSASPGPGCAGPSSASAPSAWRAREQVDHPLERALRGPDALDRGDLPSTDRIGLISSAIPSHACAPPIRPPRRKYSSVSMENQIFSSRARLARAVGDRFPRRRSAAAAAASTISPSPPTRSPSRSRARAPRCAPSSLRACAAARRCRTSRRRGGSRRSRAPLKQRLVDGHEVADRRLGGGRQVARRAQPLVEPAVVGHRPTLGFVCCPPVVT